MAIDWDKFQNEVGGMVDNAGRRTDDRLASQISSITRLTDDEIKQLFPDPADVKKLAELMQIVKAAGSRNDKLNRLVANIENYGGVLLTLLGKVA